MVSDPFFLYVVDKALVIDLHVSKHVNNYQIARFINTWHVILPNRDIENLVNIINWEQLYQIRRKSSNELDSTNYTVPMTRTRPLQGFAKQQSIAWSSN